MQLPSQLQEIVLLMTQCIAWRVQDENTLHQVVNREQWEREKGGNESKYLKSASSEGALDLDM